MGASFEDITARKAAEDGLRREKDAAEAANKELEAFSYLVSPDGPSALRLRGTRRFRPAAARGLRRTADYEGGSSTSGAYERVPGRWANSSTI